ncbi:hypothetical protein [Nonomuraea sp. NPDC005692]|uniref:hypothetical protein n=1 Tax=Nonomuraea sp. NPDC005692 TaxID=3157168 RepID=UPI0033DA4BB3
MLGVGSIDGCGGIVIGLIAAAVGLALFDAFSGLVSPSSGMENGCQIEQADGTSVPVDRAPGVDAG